MLAQRLMSSNPSIARFVMSHTPSRVLEHRGEAYARRVLARALEHTDAYPAFLRDAGVDAACADWEHFADLPLTSKRDYVERYELSSRCVDGALEGTYVIERSSGVGDGCYYWPRLPEQDTELVSQVDMGFRMYYHIDRVPTLFVSTLALGTWVGGVKMATILRDLAATGKYPISVITPGVNLEETMGIVSDLGPLYDQIVIFGYPPFLKGILDEGLARGIDWPSLNVRLATVGEGFPEEWRDHIVRMLGRDPAKDLTAVIGNYGAADLGTAVGREFPLTVLVRRLCMNDGDLSAELFGEHTAPDLFQYDPGTAYVESIDDNLVFTVDSATPLVRYAIHDRGGLLPFDTVVSVLLSHGYDLRKLFLEAGFPAEDIWPMPFLYCYGRSDGTAIVGGANVYPENVIAALTEAGDTDILGHKLAVTEGRFRILLEHRNASLTQMEARRLAQGYHRVLVEGLQRVNGEYRDQYRANRRCAEPKIEVYAAGTGPFAADVGRLKRKYTTEGHPAAA